MAKNMQPIAKRCKALGISPAVMGYAKKETNRNPGGQMRKKKSEYGIQLNEKQKVKFIYGILEKQFHAYYEAAAKTPGKTGDNLLIAVERRLDNVVYRMGFAMTRRQGLRVLFRTDEGAFHALAYNSGLVQYLNVFTLFTGFNFAFAHGVTPIRLFIQRCFRSAWAT